jgi:hypothetical protein
MVVGVLVETETASKSEISGTKLQSKMQKAEEHGGKFVTRNRV